MKVKTFQVAFFALLGLVVLGVALTQPGRFDQREVTTRQGENEVWREMDRKVKQFRHSFGEEKARLARELQDFVQPFLFSNYQDYPLTNSEKDVVMRILLALEEYRSQQRGLEFFQQTTPISAK